MDPKLKPLANRTDNQGAFMLPEDGFYQLAPFGLFPITVNKKRFIQVIDREAGEAIIANSAGLANGDGLLIDYDHFSLDLDKPSAAAGWLQELQLRDDGIYGRIRWTNRGRESVEGGEYRYLSPVFDPRTVTDLGGGKMRVTTLLNAALTNDPNLRGIKPLSNRNGGHQPQTQESSAMKEKLAGLLNLPVDAADDAFVTQVQELTNRAKAADADKAKLAELEKKQLEADVERDLDEFKDVIANRDAMKKQLLANRDSAREILAATKKAVATDSKTLPNRKDGKLPAGSTADQDKGATRAAAIRNRAAQLQQEQHLSYHAAWRRAEAETP